MPMFWSLPSNYFLLVSCNALCQSHGPANKAWGARQRHTTRGQAIPEPAPPACPRPFITTSTPFAVSLGRTVFCSTHVSWPACRSLQLAR